MNRLQNLVTSGLTAALTIIAIPGQADTLFPVEALSDQELATYRGGFTLDNLEISIGLEQVVSLNGETLAINRLTVPNLNQMISGQSVPSQVESVLGFVSPGIGGQASVLTNPVAGGWMTRIQNDLNGAIIQNARQLDIQLNNLGSGFHMPDRLREPLLEFLGR